MELSKSELVLHDWLEGTLTLQVCVEEEADFKNTAQARATLVIPDPVCKALPVIPHLVVLFREEERKKVALPGSGRAAELVGQRWRLLI